MWEVIPAVVPRGYGQEVLGLRKLEPDWQRGKPPNDLHDPAACMRMAARMGASAAAVQAARPAALRPPQNWREAPFLLALLVSHLPLGCH